MLMSKLKEMLGTVKIRLTNYLTPINYSEYSLKMLTVLRVKNLRMLQYVSLCVDALLLCVAMFLPTLLSPVSILMGAAIKYVALGIVIRKRKAQNGVYEKSKANVEFRNIEVPNIKMPEALEKFNRKQNKGE